MIIDNLRDHTALEVVNNNLPAKKMLVKFTFDSFIGKILPRKHTALTPLI